jgi:DNA polymerase-3 subunit alpha
MDKLPGSRAQKFNAIQEALDYGNKLQSAKDKHVDSLFFSVDEEMEFYEPELPIVREWEPHEILSKEREVLGFYLSDHPLRKFDVEYRSFATVHLGEEETYNLNDTVRICGIVTDLKTKIDKSGNKMAFFKMDDFSGSCECLMFGKVFPKYEEIIVPEATLLIIGRLESSGDAIKLHAEDAIPLTEVKNKLTKKVAIILDEDLHTQDTIESLKKLIEDHTGNTQLYIRIIEKKKNRDFYVDYKIELNAEFIESLYQLVGEGNVIYLTN